MSHFYHLGLIGHPVAHSLSPALHQAALQHFGLSGKYDLIDIRPENLKIRVTELIGDGYTGLNVTVPYKRELFSLADSVTPEVKKTGAINCLKVLPSGTVVAHNTDLGGFVESLKALAGDMRGHAVVLGTGGAARAAAWGLIELGYKDISLVARTRANADLLREEVSPVSDISIVMIDDLKFKRSPDLIINATDIGVKDKELPDWAIKLLQSSKAETLVYDMVYAKKPECTPFINHANTLGLKCTDGLDMLIDQAVLSFQFWTSIACPRDIMQKALPR